MSTSGIAATRQQAQRNLDEQRKRVETLLTGPVPDDLRPELAVLLQQAQGCPAGRTARLAEQRLFSSAFRRSNRGSARPRRSSVPSPTKIASLSKARLANFVLLYNSSPRAVAVVRGLDGNLVFDPAPHGGVRPPRSAGPPHRLRAACCESPQPRRTGQGDTGFLLRARNSRALTSSPSSAAACVPMPVCSAPSPQLSIRASIRPCRNRC